MTTDWLDRAITTRETNEGIRANCDAGSILVLTTDHRSAMRSAAWYFGWQGEWQDMDGAGPRRLWVQEDATDDR